MWGAGRVQNGGSANGATAAAGSEIEETEGSCGPIRAETGLKKKACKSALRDVSQGHRAQGAAAVLCRVHG